MFAAILSSTLLLSFAFNIMGKNQRKNKQNRGFQLNLGDVHAFPPLGVETSAAARNPTKAPAVKSAPDDVPVQPGQRKPDAAGDSRGPMGTLLGSQVKTSSDARHGSRSAVQPASPLLAESFDATGLEADKEVFSEFPSLSGAPHQQGQQQQQQNSQAQSLWANPSLRATQHTPVQRPQQNQNAPHQPPQRQQAPPGQQHDVRDEGPSFGQGGADDFHFGGHSNVGQLAGMSQPQTTNIEDFPPLGGLGSGAEAQQDQRSGLMQTAGFGGGASAQGSRFPMGLGQSRNPLMSPDAVSDRGSFRLGGDRLPSGGATSNGAPQQSRTAFIAQQPIGQQLGHNQAFGADAPLDGAQGQPQQQQSQASTAKRVADMTAEEKWGLPGLLAMIPTDSLDHNPLAVGQDLTILGLDLNRSDTDPPLYTTFGTPFDDPSGNPPRPVIPDFSLPPSYAVTNVPPLQSKLGSFTDETLFCIFYQYPRDLMQEHAAAELFSRDWRWHKTLKQWMMKDTSIMPPQPISAKTERGYYIFFDVQTWSRQRVCFARFFHLSPPVSLPPPRAAAF